MKLTGINIKGFKSFAKETELHFNERVTGIIGPNGSGKSNIVDAIRWVLGEQKPTELRLDNMPDVIFNGTKTIKKGSMAQVTLNFDNTKNILPTEYSNVSISRTLFGSGESEYRLNDVPCRLKDIRNLFIDTGVGPDSYAIIALGMVEDILSDHNDSRRFMFEQAAGISKFKKRKKETLQQLNITKIDLDRVEDLMFEIQTNLKELDKQAKKAKQYINLKNNYKEASVRLNLLRYDRIEESYIELTSNIDKELSLYRETDSYIISREAQLQELKKNVLLKDKDLSDFQRKINLHLDKLRSNESEKQVLDQKIRFNKSKTDEILLENQMLSDRIKDLTQSFNNLNERIRVETGKSGDLDSTLAVEETNLKQLRSRYELEKSKIDENNRIRKNLEESKFQLIKSNAVQASNIENLLKEIDLRTESLETSLKESGDLSKNLILLREQFQFLEKKLTEINLKKEEKTKSREVLMKSIEGLNIKFSATSRQLDAKRNEYKLVKSMIDKLEGFPESIKYLNKNWNSNIPLLTDIVSTSDTYKLALESYLEPFLNYFVVEDSLQALEAINMLRKSQKGKANFFILDKIISENDSGIDLPNFIPAVSIVNYEKKYEKLVRALLANVYISALDLDEINIPDADVIIINRSGSLISGGYKISGGSIGLFEGKKIGRKQSLEVLNSAIRQLENDLNSVEVEIEKSKIEAKELNKENIDQDFQQLNNDYHNIKNQVSQAEYKLDLHGKSIQACRSDIQKAGDTIAEFKISITANEKNAAEIDRQLESFSSPGNINISEIDVLMSDLSEASNRTNNAKIESLKQQNLISVLEKERDYKGSDKNNLENRLKENISLIEKMKDETGEMSLLLEKAENDLVLQYKLKAEYETQLNEIEKNYFEERNIITTLESELSEKKHQLGKSQYLINQLKEKQLDLDYNKKAISERLKIEFGTDIREFLASSRSDEEELELADKVEKLRLKIDNFGEVNTLAIEAHDEMLLRYENIEKQKKDILEAERSLKKTISEIEKTATNLFINAFDVIREHFKNVFTTLFTEGDTCDLFLENPDNPLESKILITAKPKGKRPKTISQLSGGEKTLTAIALLFSLYLFKPAPFCIFDEVDAPLDDANIMKFNNIIREFSANSQFIVVTHNKSTMTAVDILYGVFMQEPGVSEVAQADFREYENSESAATLN